MTHSRRHPLGEQHMQIPDGPRERP